MQTDFTRDLFEVHDVSCSILGKYMEGRSPGSANDDKVAFVVLTECRVVFLIFKQ